jgi:hypothetical protein
MGFKAIDRYGLEVLIGLSLMSKDDELMQLLSYEVLEELVIT